MSSKHVILMSSTLCASLSLAAVGGCATTPAATPDARDQVEAVSEAPAERESVEASDTAPEAPAAANAYTFSAADLYQKWNETDLAMELSLDCSEPCIITVTGAVANVAPFDTTLPARYEPDRDVLELAAGEGMVEVGFADDAVEEAKGGLDQGALVTVQCPPPEGMMDQRLMLAGCTRTEG